MHHSSFLMENSDFPITLASASPRRLQLLEQIGINPEKIVHPRINETPQKKELPRQYVQRLAQEKLSAGRELSLESPMILAADTVAAAGRRILNKTQDVKIAEKQLRLLSGRRHRVYTAVILYNAKTQRISSRLVCTIVHFSRLTDKQLFSYLETDEWKDKAGSYSIQGYAASFIKSINGSYSNVVGLPLFETAQLIRGQGLIP